VRAADGRLEHASDDLLGARHRGLFTGEQQTIAVRVNGNAERGLQRRKVAVVLSEEANAIGKLAEIYETLRGQRNGYSSRRARGFPRTSAAIIARTTSLRPARRRRRAGTAGAAAGGGVRG